MLVDFPYCLILLITGLKVNIIYFYELSLMCVCVCVSVYIYRSVASWGAVFFFFRIQAYK
jgi:hypothetical protein